MKHQIALKRTSANTQFSNSNVNLNGSWNVTYQKNIQYPLITTQGVFELNNDILSSVCGLDKESRAFVVVDQFIASIYQEKMEEYFKEKRIKAIIIPFLANETNKTYEEYLSLFSKLDKLNLRRRGEPLIAIGGGVLTDVVGFVASTYRRSIPHVKIPTTLMGYVDASVGIKTGVNFGKEKNRMGSFEPPRAVILDKTFLKTLPQRHIINGIGEILKLAVIKDRILFNLLEQVGENCIKDAFQHQGDAILNRSIQGMIEELEPNLYEDNLERVVDFGHTFSPAIEMIEKNGLLHGEAVAIDVAFSSVLAFNRGFLDAEALERILRLSQKLGLPTQYNVLDPDLLWEGLIERTAHRDGKQRVPLPIGIGDCVFVNDISMNELKKSYEYINQKQ